MRFTCSHINFPILGGRLGLLLQKETVRVYQSVPASPAPAFASAAPVKRKRDAVQPLPSRVVNLARVSGITEETSAHASGCVSVGDYIVGCMTAQQGWVWAEDNAEDQGTDEGKGKGLLIDTIGEGSISTTQQQQSESRPQAPSQPQRHPEVLLDARSPNGYDAALSILSSVEPNSGVTLRLVRSDKTATAAACQQMSQPAEQHRPLLPYSNLVAEWPSLVLDVYIKRTAQGISLPKAVDLGMVISKEKKGSWATGTANTTLFNGAK